MIVSKFGGSSVADDNQIRKVKAILESDERRRIAVVSAPGKRNKEDQKITDLLYKCNSMVQKGQTCRPVFNEISKRFVQIAQKLHIDDVKISEKLDDIRCMIDAGRGADYAASRGEYLSALIISEFLGWEFLDAQDVIVINQDSTVNEATYKKLAEKLDPEKNYVIPGFYGETEQGVLKTELSYKEVRELSDVGATVFHEEAIAPIYGIGIPIVVKNTNKPEDPGTKIIDADDVKGPCGVSARGGLSRIRLRKLMLFKKYGMRHALLTMLHIFGIRPCYSLFGIDSIVWFFDSKMANDSVCQAMCERLTKEFGLDSITVDHGHAILGIAGGEMDSSDVYLDAAMTLRENGIDTTFVNYGSSDASVLIGIKEEQAAEAVKAVYNKLF